VSVPDPPPAAVEVFGPGLERARRYATWLAGAGVERGLLGPREVPRLWDRHLLNSAAVAPVLPRSAQLLDIGSGAGLPGIPLAVARPDLTVTLVEPLLRRSTYLAEVVADLGLDNVTVLRARAEDVPPGQADAAAARAVAPLERLVRLALPAVRPGGVLVALKGRSAEDEVEAALPVLRRLGARSWEVREFPVPGSRVPTRAVLVVAGKSRVNR
jgi:16S rRNA (guanine527-N7)-methyltransferase